MRIAMVLGTLVAVAAADVVDELVKAQRRGDVVEVQRQLTRLREDWREEAKKAKRLRADRTPQQLHALMMKLDPKRSGAFVSAPSIARHLLLMASATGDTKFVEDAAKVVRANTTQRGAGKCAKAMNLYTDGLLARIKKDDVKAAFFFDKAFAMMRDEGWTPLAMHAAVENAAALVRQRNVDGAATAIASLAEIFPAGSDISLSYILRQLYQTHLAGAPAEVKQAYEKVMKPHTGPRSVSSAGGRGGRGGHGGMDLSKVGEGMRKFGRKKALMTVRRADKGFEIRQGFDKSFKAEQPYKHGTKYHEDGGVTLGFWNFAVGLYMIDPEGCRVQPGESSSGPSGELAYYFLARKEKWTVTKRGVVAIK